jgi:hypothetical protein
MWLQKPTEVFTNNGKMTKDKIHVSVGDLVRWKYWMSDVFEGPPPLGLVVKIYDWSTPHIAEVLYTTGRIQHESTEALEIVLPKAVNDTN